MSAATFRKRVYAVLDEVLESGRPVEIERRGRRVRVVAVDAPGKLARLKRRRFIEGDPEELVHLDWWRELGA